MHIACTKLAICMQFHNKELERGYGRYHAKHYMGELCIMGQRQMPYGSPSAADVHMYAACCWPHTLGLCCCINAQHSALPAASGTAQQAVPAQLAGMQPGHLHQLAQVRSLQGGTAGACSRAVPATLQQHLPIPCTW